MFTHDDSILQLCGDSNNGMAPSRQRAIAWKNEGPTVRHFLHHQVWMSQMSSHVTGPISIRTMSDSPLVWLKTYKNVSRTAVLENACKPISIKIAICLCIAVISQTACFIENCLLRLHIKQVYLDNSFTLSLFPETIKRYNNIFVKKLSATHIVGQGAVIWILLKGEGNVCILYGQ